MLTSMASDGGAPEILWTPDPTHRGPLAAFTDWVAEHRGVTTQNYAELHEWSIVDLDGFWSAIVEYFGVRFRAPYRAVLADDRMPGAQWFPGGTLNYAERVLTDGPGRGVDDVALEFEREDGLARTVTHGELRDLVARARAGLMAHGVGQGDRVVALAPNCVETLVAFLAAASLGAIWSSCSPDFGVRAVHDRFAQIEPTMLVAVDGYVYGGKRYDIRATVEALRDQLPTLRATVLVPYLDPDATLTGALPWADFTADAGPLEFTDVPFEHPLWVLYSSGTTGLPKGIVHSHGGIVLEHLKGLALQLDLRPGERFFWHTTTGWTMWNILIGGLLVGSTIVLYDGNPGHPDMGTVWRLAQRHRINLLGVSAPYLQASVRAGIRPRDEYDLAALRAIGSTGAPLSTEGFRWVADAVGGHIQICSVSGGTDVCAAFVGSAPTVPVWLGEISCAALGVAATAFDDAGHEIIDEVGELVITRPMPSMPVMFWNDDDGSRLHEAYFADYEGVWRHGDWARVTPRGSFVIYGRSDSTLNRGGVRMGTADFYAVVEGFDEVLDSLVIDTTELAAKDEGALLCFLVLAPGTELADVEPKLRSALRTELSPRHVPDRFDVIDKVPRTLNGKKCEVPVKRILAGHPPEKAVSRGALADPDALAPFLARAGGGS
jgi:acetoacetyl-CoA synthetase